MKFVLSLPVDGERLYLVALGPGEVPGYCTQILSRCLSVYSDGGSSAFVGVRRSDSDWRVRASLK